MNIQTERLIGEKLHENHLPLLLQMNSNEKVMKTLGGIRSEEQTREFLQHNINHWNRYGFGIFILKNKNGEFIGRAGLRHVDIEGIDEIEVAYALMPEFWNQGLATEIAKKLIAIAFEQLHIKKLVCFTESSNKASERVMQKVGFVFKRIITYKNIPNVVLYELFADQ